MGSLCSHSLELTGLAGNRESRVHRLDPRAKIVACAAIAFVAVSTPLRLWPVYLACAAVLVALAALARVPPAQIWRRARWVLPLVLVAGAFLPLVRSGGASWALGPLTVHEAGLAGFAQLAAKTSIGVGAAILLTSTTSFPEVIAGLEALRLPTLLVLIAALMHRYLYVIAADVGRMRAALAARAYRPRNALQAAALGKLAGSLFLRCFERGERVNQAMLARGYERRMPRLRPLALGGADIAVLAAVPALLLAARVLAGVTS